MAIFIVFVLFKVILSERPPKSTTAEIFNKAAEKDRFRKAWDNLIIGRDQNGK